MNTHPGHPKFRPPVQAHPVARNSGDEPPSRPTGPGAEAARSTCAHLPGLARQMCYAARYGG
ncbi:hypothetical protein [Kitasatospora sp. NPDC050463]|uniref:hypothetical protein n=1 Tax=Kitasatospora sp. NPDC050463 TaxID=3155786 RepID=UPI0033D57DEC